MGLNRVLRDQWKASRRYARLAERENTKKASKLESPSRSAAHRGQLVTAVKPDTSRMTAAQKKVAERNMMVDVPAMRRMARKLRPNLRLENMRYHRPPSPTPEERLLAKKLAAAEKARAAATGDGHKGLGIMAKAKATAALDALFAE